MGTRTGRRTFASKRSKGDPARLVAELARMRAEFGGDLARRKLALLREIQACALRAKTPLLELHESLLFLRAYPDSAEVLEAAESGLGQFAVRLDALGKRAREAFDETGVAGSALHCAFALPVLRALREKFPSSISFDAEGEGIDARLDEALINILPPAELEAYADGYLDSREWFRAALEGGSEEDPLRTLLELVEHLEAGDPARRALWSALEVPVRWELRVEDGSRSLARAPSVRHVFHTSPLRRQRIDLRAEMARPPLPVRRVDAHEATRWIDAALSSVTCRLREMYTFMHASSGDVVTADLGDGLEIGIIGVAPAARHALRAFHGFLLSKNGVPIGYGDVVTLFDWGEVNFHIYETFRQGESARVYASAVRVFHHHFGISYLFLNRYQFGHHNEDAIHSGAFWFYEKMGFRPHEPKLVDLWKTERKKIGDHPTHRTSRRDLRRLSSEHMGLALSEDAAALEAYYEGFHPMNLALAASRRIERDHGGDRTRVLQASLDRLHPILAAATPGFRTAEEMRALERVAPILDLIPNLEHWADEDLRDLADLLRAKAGLRELDYLRATRRVPKLKDALVTIGRRGGLTKPRPLSGA